MGNVATLNTLLIGDSGVPALIPEIYSKRIYQKAMNQMLWSKFMGSEGSNMPIIVKSELLKEPGDTINIIRTLDMTGAAQTGTLRGNEEKMQTEVLQTTPSLKRHGMAWKALVAKRITFDKRQRAMFLLARRWRKELDDSIWTAIAGTGGGFSTTAPDIIWGGNSTGLSDIDSTDTLDVDDIDKARMGLEADNAVPVGGEEGYYCAFLHTRQCYYLGISSAWRQYQQYADVRGLDNWLFKGGKRYGGINAFGYWNGVAIFKTNQCPIVESTTSPECDVATGVVVGIEATAHTIEAYLDGQGQEIEGVRYTEEVDDYGNDIGVGTAMSFQDKNMTSENIKQIKSACNNPIT